MIILGVLYMLFGTSFYLLNLGRVEDQSFVPDISPFWSLDAFMNMYELGIGEFEIDAYRSNERNVLLINLLFVVSAFMIQITFLNMLIAIMGDTFDHCTEQKENNGRLTKLSIMNDYVNLISQDMEGDEKNP